MDKDLASEIGKAIEEIVAEICPDAASRPMYGGTVFEIEAGNPKTLTAGHYAYKNHVSLEFSNGSGFDDPDGLLQGKGKHRRHLKLRSLADLSALRVRFYLQQAFA